MVIDISVFEVLILGALLVTCMSPLILIGLLIQDWKKDRLW